MLPVDPVVPVARSLKDDLTFVATTLPAHVEDAQQAVDKAKAAMDQAQAIYEQARRQLDVLTEAAGLVQKLTEAL